MATVKIIELSGSSADGWQEAAQSAAKTAAKTIHNLIGIEVVGWTADIDDTGEIVRYKANLKVAFKVEDD